MTFEKTILASAGSLFLGATASLLQQQETIPHAIGCAVVGFVLLLGYTYLVEKQASEKAVKMLSETKKKRKTK